jgi:Protein of unknown function (DUF2735)
MTYTERPSATIYQFPVGGRAALRTRNEKTTGEYLASLGVCEAASGGSWYHEEAMEAERFRKN